MAGVPSTSKCSSWNDVTALFQSKNDQNKNNRCECLETTCAYCAFHPSRCIIPENKDTIHTIVQTEGIGLKTSKWQYAADCPVCQLSFKGERAKVKYTLDRHLRVHYGDLNPAFVTACVQCFSLHSVAYRNKETVDSIGVHMKKQHNISSSKDYHKYRMIDFTSNVPEQSILDATTYQRFMELPDSIFEVMPGSRLEQIYEKSRNDFITDSTNLKVLCRVRRKGVVLNRVYWYWACPLCKFARTKYAAFRFRSSTAMRFTAIIHLISKHSDIVGLSAFLKPEMDLLYKRTLATVDHLLSMNIDERQETKGRCLGFYISPVTGALKHLAVDQATESTISSRNERLFCLLCCQTIYHERHIATNHPEMTRNHTWSEFFEVNEDNKELSEAFPTNLLRYWKEYVETSIDKNKPAPLDCYGWRCPIAECCNDENGLGTLAFPTIVLLRAFVLRHLEKYHSAVFTKEFFYYEWATIRKEMPNVPLSLDLQTFNPHRNPFVANFDIQDPNDFAYPAANLVLPTEAPELRICGFCYWTGSSALFLSHITRHHQFWNIASHSLYNHRSIRDVCKRGGPLIGKTSASLAPLKMLCSSSDDCSEDVHVSINKLNANDSGTVTAVASISEMTDPTENLSSDVGSHDVESRTEVSDVTSNNAERENEVSQGPTELKHLVADSSPRKSSIFAADNTIDSRAIRNTSAGPSCDVYDREESKVIVSPQKQRKARLSPRKRDDLGGVSAESLMSGNESQMSEPDIGINDSVNNRTCEENDSETESDGDTVYQQLNSICSSEVIDGGFVRLHTTNAVENKNIISMAPWRSWSDIVGPAPATTYDETMVMPEQPSVPDATDGAASTASNQVLAPPVTSDKTVPDSTYGICANAEDHVAGIINGKTSDNTEQERNIQPLLGRKVAPVTEAKCGRTRRQASKRARVSLATILGRQRIASGSSSSSSCVSSDDYEGIDTISSDDGDADTEVVTTASDEEHEIRDSKRVIHKLADQPDSHASIGENDELYDNGLCSTSDRTEENTSWSRIVARFEWTGDPPVFGEKEESLIELMQHNRCGVCPNTQKLHLNHCSSREVREMNMLAHMIMYHYDNKEVVAVLNMKRYLLSLSGDQPPPFLFHPAQRHTKKKHLICSSCGIKSFPRLSELTSHFDRCLNAGGVLEPGKDGVLVVKRTTAPRNRRTTTVQLVPCPIKCASNWRPSKYYSDEFSQVCHLVTFHSTAKESYDAALRINSVAKLHETFPFLDVKRTFANIAQKKNGPMLACAKCDLKFARPNEIVKHAQRYHQEKPIEKIQKCPLSSCTRGFIREAEGRTEDFIQMWHVINKHLPSHDAVVWLSQRNWSEIMAAERTYKIDLEATIRESLMVGKAKLVCALCEAVYTESGFRHHLLTNDCIAQDSIVRRKESVGTSVIASDVPAASSATSVRKIRLPRRSRGIKCSRCFRNVTLCNGCDTDIMTAMHLISVHRADPSSIADVANMNIEKYLTESPYVDVVETMRASLEFDVLKVRCAKCDTYRDSLTSHVKHLTSHGLGPKRAGVNCPICEKNLTNCVSYSDQVSLFGHCLSFHKTGSDREKFEQLSASWSLSEEFPYIDQEKSMNGTLTCSKCGVAAASMAAISQHAKIYHSESTSRVSTNSSTPTRVNHGKQQAEVTPRGVKRKLSCLEDMKSKRLPSVNVEDTTPMIETPKGSMKNWLTMTPRTFASNKNTVSFDQGDSRPTLREALLGNDDTSSNNVTNASEQAPRKSSSIFDILTNSAARKATEELSRQPPDVSHIHGVEAVKCGHCAFGARNMMDLRLHVKLSHSEALGSDTNKIVPCPLCDLVFSERDKLLSHISSRHSMEQSPWPCGYCSRLFVTKQRMREHERRIHESARLVSADQLKCKHCQESFTNVRNRDIHEKRHENPKSNIGRF